MGNPLAGLEKDWDKGLYNSSIPRFIGVREVDGKWEGAESHHFGEMSFVANPTLFIIREAWHKGLDLEAEADGYGQGFGTNGDWSGIRDSSEDAVNVMLTKALNYLFGEVSK